MDLRLAEAPQHGDFRTRCMPPMMLVMQKAIFIELLRATKEATEFGSYGYKLHIPMIDDQRWMKIGLLP